MFRKLKWQFILTNLAIISALFFSLTVGAYLLLQTNMVNHAKLFTQRLATAINSGEFQSFPSKTPPMPHDFPRNNSLLPHDGPGPMLHDIPKNKAPMPNQLQIQHGEGFAIVLRNKAPEHNDNSIPPFFPRVDGHTPNEIQLPPVFFIKTASNGVINFQSDKLSFSAGQLTSLASQILHRNPAKVDDGVITFLQTQYFFFKTPRLDQPGMLMVFQDLRPEENVLHSLVMSLIITGLIFLTLSLLGSLFMSKRAIGPIQKAWQQQKDFLADASHEFRTPLAIIQTNLEVVMSSPDETVASQIDWLTNIKEETQQMTNLVTSLLFLARADSHQWVLNPRYFSLNNVVERATDAFKPIATAKNIALDVNAPAEISALIDESSIRQVIAILLDNAIRYTPPQGKISVALSRTDKKILLRVTDTGVGIAAAHLDKIFDRFYQIDSSRSKKGQAGLGLAIAKCIITNHGGTIQATSVPDGGTTFTIQLPLPKIVPGEGERGLSV